MCDLNQALATTSDIRGRLAGAAALVIASEDWSLTPLS